MKRVGEFKLPKMASGLLFRGQTNGAHCNKQRDTFNKLCWAAVAFLYTKPYKKIRGKELRTQAVDWLTRMGFPRTPSNILSRTLATTQISNSEIM